MKKASLSWVTNSWKNSCMKNINSQSEVQSLDEISAKRFQPHSTVGGDSFSKFLFSWPCAHMEAFQAGLSVKKFASPVAFKFDLCPR